MSKKGSKPNKERSWKRIVLAILPGLIVATLVWSANVYYGLDVQKVIVEETQKIIGQLESTATTTLATLSGRVGIATSTPRYALEAWGSAGFGTSTTPTLYVDSGNGRVGIGTASPDTSLDVSGAVLSGGSFFTRYLNSGIFFSGLDDYNTGIKSDANDNLGLRAGSGIDRMTILASTGNVGIATSTPTYKLHVWGSAGFGTSTTPVLYVDSGNGRVGIGTTTPEAILQISDQSGTSNLIRAYSGGSLKARLDEGGALFIQDEIQLQQRGTETDPGYTWIVDSTTGLFNPTTSVLAITTAGTERLRIDALGKVGIATSTPTQALTVQGNIFGSGYLNLYGTATSTLGGPISVTGFQMPTSAQANYVLTAVDSSGYATWQTTSGITPSNWQFIGPNAITPTTTVGIIINASSTISHNLTVGTSTALYVDSGSGRVGIATTTLYSGLTLGGTGSLSGITFGSNVNLYNDTGTLKTDNTFYVVGGIVNYSNMLMDSTRYIGLGSSAGRIVFDNQTPDYLTIRDAYFGIATTTPSYPLHVWGSAGFGTSTTPTLYVDSGNGRVGIATTTPNQALTVQGNIFGSGYLNLYGTATSTLGGPISVTGFQMPTSAQANYVLTAVDSSGYATWQTTSGITPSNWQFIGPNAIRPTTTVGIIVSASSTFASNLTISGIATTTNIYPSADNLYVLGASGYRWANLYAATTTIGGTITIDTDDIRATGLMNITAAAASTWKTTSGDLTIQSADTLTATSTGAQIFAAGGAERIRLTTAGYLGIATSTPSYPLHVWGSAGFGTSTTPTLYVDSGNGRVGIQTTSPSYTFDITGTLRTTATTTINSDLIVSGALKNTVTKIVAANNTPNKNARADYVCDGVDDHVQINQALTDVANAGGGVVLLLEGTYNTSSTIQIGTSTILIGEGYSTVIRPVNGYIFDIIENSDQTGGNKYIEIRDLRIDGNRLNAGAGDWDAIQFDEVSDSKIVNVWIHDVDRFGVYLASVTNRVLISQSWFKDCGDYCISMGGSGGYNIIDSNEIRNSVNGKGIRSGGAAYNTYSNNYISISAGDSGAGAISDYGGYSVIANNTIDGNSVAWTNGITIERPYDTVVGNNISNINYRGIWTVYYSDNNTITGNFIDCWGTGGAGISIQHFSSENPARNVVAANQIYDCPTGINLPGDYDQNLIEGNSVEGSTTGINIGSGADANIIRGNDLRGNTTAISDSGTGTLKVGNITSDWIGEEIIISSPTSTALTVTQSGTGDILNLFAGATEVFTVTDDGYVGIATTTPSYPLHVWGSAGFGTSTTPTLYVDSGNGRVGIGTTSPVKKLDVVGGINATQEICLAGDCRTSWPEGVSGNGTLSFIPIWNGASSLNNSVIYQGEFNVKGGTEDIGPTTVDTTSNDEGTGRAFQRKTFYAKGRHWFFYSDGTDAVWTTSIDGNNWETPSTLVSGGVYGGCFGIWFDGTYVHYAFNKHEEANHPLVYRRGTPNSNGTITWSAAEQTVLAANVDRSYNGPSVTVDSSGYPWIAYENWDRTNSIAYPYVTKSSTTDGTWNTATGFPYQLSINSDANGQWRAGILALTASKVYAFYGRNNAKTKGQLWNGSSWGSEETCNYATANQGVRNTSFVSEGDDIHLVYQQGILFKKIRYTKRDYSTGLWLDTNEIILEDPVDDYVAPSLARVSDGTLYCFWQERPTANHIFYKKQVAGTWDTNPTDWINEETDTLPDNPYQTCSYRDYGGKISFVYLSTSTSPYNVRFKALSFTGNIGIATTSPQYSLHVWGSAGFGTSTTPTLYVDSGNGRVGIATTTPAAKLEVAGNIKLSLPGTGTGWALCHTTQTGTTNQEIVDCTSAPSADYAEMYPVEEGIEPGDLVAPSQILVQTTDGYSLAKLTKTTQPYQPTLIGVVSDPNTATDFNVIGYNIDEKDNPMPIAISGRVLIKVSIENGEISVGDPLTSASSTPGVAMKATKAGRVIGIALESFNGSTTQCEKETICESGDSATTTCQEVESCTTFKSEIGKIMVFINPHWIGNDLIVKQNSSGQIVQIDIRSELALLGLIVNEYGVLEVQTLKTKKVSAEEFEMKDKVTGEVYCTWIENGEWKKVKGECGSLTSASTQSSGESQTATSSELINGADGVIPPQIDGITSSSTEPVPTETPITTENIITEQTTTTDQPLTSSEPSTQTESNTNESAPTTTETP